MAATKTIGILTGGGDVPGLNPCIKQLVTRAAHCQFSILGIRRGWQGLLAYNPDDPSSYEKNLQPLTPADVRTIDRSGGTILHTSRTNPSAVAFPAAPDFLKPQYASEEPKKDFTAHILANLARLEIDTLDVLEAAGTKWNFLPFRPGLVGGQPVFGLQQHQRARAAGGQTHRRGQPNNAPADDGDIILR